MRRVLISVSPCLLFGLVPTVLLEVRHSNGIVFNFSGPVSASLAFISRPPIPSSSYAGLSCSFECSSQSTTLQSPPLFLTSVSVSCCSASCFLSRLFYSPALPIKLFYIRSCCRHLGLCVSCIPVIMPSSFCFLCLILSLLYLPLASSRSMLDSGLRFLHPVFLPSLSLAYYCLRWCGWSSCFS